MYPIVGSAVTFAGSVAVMYYIPSWGAYALLAAGLVAFFALRSRDRVHLLPGRTFPAGDPQQGRFQRVLRTHGYTKGRLLYAEGVSRYGSIHSLWRGNDLVVSRGAMELPAEQQEALYVQAAVSRQHHLGFKGALLGAAPMLVNFLIRFGTVLVLGDLTVVQAILLTVVTSTIAYGTTSLRLEIGHHANEVVDRVIAKKVGKSYVDCLESLLEATAPGDYKNTMAPLIGRRIETAKQVVRRNEYAS